MLDSLSRIWLVLGLLLPVWAQQNVLLSNTSPDIIYNPPLCASSSRSADCTSPWQVSNNTVVGTTIVYTDGPTSQTGNVVPQMFLTFRASAVYLHTTSLSNATVNFTLTAEPTDATITAEVNTSISLIVAVDIPETQTTTLGITFLPEDQHTLFDIESITLVVTNASATSSFLPSPSLPASSSPPTIVPSPTPSPTPNLGARSSKAATIGAVLSTVLSVFCL